jgi:hypothetical protein
MTWQWIVFVAIIAIYAIGVQAIHSWKEVRMIQQMPDDMLRELQNAQSAVDRIKGNR